MILISFLLHLVLFPLTTCLPLLTDSADSAVGTIWTFPNGTWIENLAVRQNSQILCNSLTKAAMYLVDPFSHTASLVHQFQPEEDLLGITEIADDVFAFVSANISFVDSTAWPGSAKLWRIDVGAWEMGHSDAVTLVANMTDVGLPDGIVFVPESPGLALLADASKGKVWKVDVWSGEYSVAFQNEVFLPNSTALPLGIDGVRIWNGYLYYTNLAQSQFARVPIDRTGSAIGPIEQIASTSYGDDFAVAQDGTAYVVGGNTLYRVSQNGTVDVLAGGPDDLTLEGATSAQFGRTRIDEDVLYISTNGGLLVPVEGTIHGGQILAVNVGLFD